MRKPKQDRRSDPLSCPLYLDVLEDRCLLSYTLTDLGSLGGGSGAAYGINDAGQVVGYATDSNHRGRATLWDGGVSFDLGTLGGPESVANAINDQGQIVGFSDNGAVPERAFLWQDGVMSDLGTLGGEDSQAFHINNAEQVVGVSDTPPGIGGGAFLWDGGVMSDLGTLGGFGAGAFGINDAGEVVGGSLLPNNQNEHAFLWQDGVLTDLGTLPGDPDSEATAINNAGQIVGASGVIEDDISTRAAIWQDGTWTAIGPVNSYATAINDAGQVVGFMSSSDGETRDHAFIYSDGQLNDLNDLIPPGSGLTLAAASAINNAGQIVGTAYSGGAVPHAFLLTPDSGCAPRGAERGVFRLLVPAREATPIGEIMNQPPERVLPKEAPPATVTPLPADAVLARATDTVFAHNHQPPTTALDGAGELAGLESGQLVIPQLFSLW
jgi:probable HAF family extracellular repeat protein